jgi:hypothetical protein
VGVVRGELVPGQRRLALLAGAQGDGRIEG